MTTLSDGLRQSDRVRFRMPVEASWLTTAGVTLTQNAETLLVSRNGGVLRLTEKLSMGQELHLRRNLEDRLIPRRNRPRINARVLACIRHRGFQEEIAVCEDLSKGGLSFRSRNQYPEGSRVEVAVPFTPGTGAIFVPIRIVFSQAIPTAGLYRHGAAYIKPPLDI